jgi:hypothetical protein
VTLLLGTGGDDLRGGNDDVDATVGFVDGTTQVFTNINRGRRWADHCSASVYLPFTKQVARSKIAWVRLTTSAAGGVGGDNWNLNSLTIQDEGRGIVFYQRAGSPLKRFTGESKTFTASF